MLDFEIWDLKFWLHRNYVVQYVFDLQLPWATVDILNQLEGNYADLSVQKFSSNVVEKCLHYAGEDYQPRVIQELIDNPRLDQIMLDPYGNYVIQAALSQSKVSKYIILIFFFNGKSQPFLLCNCMIYKIILRRLGIDQSCIWVTSLFFIYGCFSSFGVITIVIFFSIEASISSSWI